MHGNVRDDPEQHRITLTSAQKWSQDFFERFPKVYGNVFCLDKATRSPSFKVRIVAEQKWKNSSLFVHLVLGPRIRRESRVLAPEWGYHFNKCTFTKVADFFLSNLWMLFQNSALSWNLVGCLIVDFDSKKVTMAISAVLPTLPSVVHSLKLKGRYKQLL